MTLNDWNVTLTGINKIHEPTRKISMKIDLYYRQENVRRWFDFGIRYSNLLGTSMRIFYSLHWKKTHSLNHRGNESLHRVHTIQSCNLRKLRIADREEATVPFWRPTTVPNEAERSTTRSSYSFQYKRSRLRQLFLSLQLQRTFVQHQHTIHHGKQRFIWPCERG